MNGYSVRKIKKVMRMQTKLTFHGKAINVTFSKKASLQCRKLGSNLLIEIQIYFSCLLGKRLAFYTDKEMKGTWSVDTDLFISMLNDSQKFSDNVFIRFNTVMTKDCPVSDYAGPPPVTDFKINNQKPYVPDWLNIDFKNGEWFGEYGWLSSEAGQCNTKQVRGNSIQT